MTAAPNPLRGIAHDSAYVASFMRQIPGPVLAVGHSYGGAVISNAATGLDNVVGLVFVAAFAPDEGERLGEVAAGSRDSVLGTAQVALQHPSPDGAATVIEFAIDHPGPCSRPPTRLPAGTWSGRWPSGPEPPSPKSRAARDHDVPARRGRRCDQDRGGRGEPRGRHHGGPGVGPENFVGRAE